MEYLGRVAPDLEGFIGTSSGNPESIGKVLLSSKAEMSIKVESGGVSSTPKAKVENRTSTYVGGRRKGGSR